VLLDNANVVNLARKIFISPIIQVKLGLTKFYIKAMNKHGDWFNYLKEKFPHISDAKINENIFVAAQIRKLLKDVIFKTKLIQTEKREMDAFGGVSCNFFGNKEDDKTTSNPYIQEILSH
jgi:hypothetical protein